MIDAMANNEILQIVVFSLFVGVAITAVGEKAQAAGPRASRRWSTVMLQVTDYVMRFAPFAVFAAVTATIAEQGLGDPRHLRLFHGQLLSRAWSSSGRC